MTYSPKDNTPASNVLGKFARVSELNFPLIPFSLCLGSQSLDSQCIQISGSISCKAVSGLDSFIRPFSYNPSLLRFHSLPHNISRQILLLNSRSVFSFGTHVTRSSEAHAWTVSNFRAHNQKMLRQGQYHHQDWQRNCLKTLFFKLFTPISFEMSPHLVAPSANVTSVLAVCSF